MQTKDLVILRKKFKLVKRLRKMAEGNEIARVKKSYALIDKFIIEVDDLLNDSIFKQSNG